jgi:hypothetical protein
MQRLISLPYPLHKPNLVLSFVLAVRLKHEMMAALWSGWIYLIWLAFASRQGPTGIARQYIPQDLGVDSVAALVQGIKAIQQPCCSLGPT